MHRQLFAKYPPESILKCLPPRGDELPEGAVDESLVIPTAGCVNLRSKPRKDIIVNSYSDPGLSRRYWNHRPPFPLGEVIVFPHGLPLVFLAFTPGGPARRNNPKLLAPPGVHNDQETTQGIDTQCDEPVFLRLLIRDGDCQLVSQHRDCVSKVDAMLPQVGGRLLAVPLEIHSATICTSVHRVKIDLGRTVDSYLNGRTRKPRAPRHPQGRRGACRSAALTICGRYVLGGFGRQRRLGWRAALVSSMRLTRG